LPFGVPPGQLNLQTGFANLEIFRVNLGVADWRDEFVRGGYAATHKFIPGLSNA
jgi:hypothetical protein